LPPVAALEIALKESTKLTEVELNKSLELLKEISNDKSEQQLGWLLDTTEKFCQEKAIYNAIMDSIQILDGKDTNRGKGSIPTLLSDALGVSFDPHIGHDFLDSYADRYDFYHRIEKRIPFDLEYFNKITDANLMNVSMDDLMNMPKDMYEKRMGKLKEKVKGKLIIKEYPTASANPAHFRALLNDLALKKNFKPDIIFVDYLNICASARIKAGANVNSYTYIKAIAEELRGLAVENNVPIVSATQTTRSGFSNSDPGLEDTSESFGLPATADFMFALVSNEELQQLNQMLVKQLKNRYNDPNLHKRFTIGVDRAKMKLYDLEQKAQDAVLKEAESKPVFDRGRSTDKFKNLKV